MKLSKFSLITGKFPSRALSLIYIFWNICSDFYTVYIIIYQNNRGYSRSTVHLVIHLILSMLRVYRIWDAAFRFAKHLHLTICIVFFVHTIEAYSRLHQERSQLWKRFFSTSENIFYITEAKLYRRNKNYYYACARRSDFIPTVRSCKGCRNLYLYLDISYTCIYMAADVMTSTVYPTISGLQDWPVQW